MTAAPSSARRRPSGATATRARLLAAALHVFAERGFRRGTMRAICRRAGVNGASANYHFRSKGRLYRAVLRDAFARLQREAPFPDATTAPRTQAEARARLRSVVEGIASSLLAPRAAPHALLALREMTEPTAALDDIVDDAIRPRFEAICAAVRGLRPGASDLEVRFAALSVVGQVVYHRTAGPVALRLLGEKAYGPPLVRAVVDHVVAFSERALLPGAARDGGR